MSQFLLLDSVIIRSGVLFVLSYMPQFMAIQDNSESILMMMFDSPLIIQYFAAQVFSSMIQNAQQKDLLKEKFHENILDILIIYIKLAQEFNDFEFAINVKTIVVFLDSNF